MSAHRENLSACSVSRGYLFFYKDLQVLSECGFQYHESKLSFKASMGRAFSKPKFSHISKENIRVKHFPTASHQEEVPKQLTMDAETNESPAVFVLLQLLKSKY